MTNILLKYYLCLLLLFYISTSHAVAPRITQDMFGQEASSDILTYPLSNIKDENLYDIAIDIISHAFAAEDLKFSIDVVPSKQLALYTLFNGDVMALIGKRSDFSAFDDTDYFQSVFYIDEHSPDKTPLALIIDKNTPDAQQIFQRFNQGLIKIIDNQTYFNIIKTKLKDTQSIDYKESLRHYNQGW